MPPCFKLIIVGTEHDAVQLCQYAALTGWEVTIVAEATESKSIIEGNLNFGHFASKLQIRWLCQNY